MKAVVESRGDSLPAEISPTTLNEQTVLLQVIARAAADQTVDLERMERLLIMHERLVAKQAERDFVEAMARFKSNPPKIVKDKHVAFTTQKGTTEYDHATLGKVCEDIVKSLGDVGISHRWDLAQSESQIKVTCVLTHAQGHSQSTSLHTAADASGGKNDIQAIGSAVTYLQRYTLLAATGLAAMDADDDGRKSDQLKEIPEGPQGYQSWRADMAAKADDGTGALKAAWEKSPEKFRAFAASKDSAWWNGVKASAAQADVKRVQS